MRVTIGYVYVEGGESGVVLWMDKGELSDRSGVSGFFSLLEARGVLVALRCAKRPFLSLLDFV